MTKLTTSNPRYPVRVTSVREALLTREAAHKVIQKDLGYHSSLELKHYLRGQGSMTMFRKATNLIHYNRNPMLDVIELLLIISGMSMGLQLCRRTFLFLGDGSLSIQE